MNCRPKKNTWSPFIDFIRPTNPYFVYFVLLVFYFSLRCELVQNRNRHFAFFVVASFVVALLVFHDSVRAEAPTPQPLQPTKWSFAAESEIDNGVNFWKDNLLFGSQDSKLYCLNAATGELVWKFAIQDQIRCMPTIVGDRSFVAGCDSTLHIIDLTQGKEASSVPIEAPTGVTPAVLGDNVYFGTEGGALFAVNWKEAKITWKAEDKASSQPYRSSP